MDGLFREAGRNHQFEHAFHLRRALNDASSAMPSSSGVMKSRMRSWRTAQRGSAPARRLHRSGASSTRRMVGCCSTCGSITALPDPCHVKPMGDGAPIFERARNGDRRRRRHSSHYTLTRNRSSLTGYSNTERRSSKAAGRRRAPDGGGHRSDDRTSLRGGNSFERYAFDGAARLQQRLHELPRHANVVIAPEQHHDFRYRRGEGDGRTMDARPGTAARVSRR
jgi:hypothetical protein